MIQKHPWLVGVAFGGLIAIAHAQTIGGFGGGGSGSSTTPGAPVSSLQFNNAGAFGGITNWTSDGVNTLTGAAGTTLAVGGATIGTDSLAVNGTFTNNVTTAKIATSSGGVTFVAGIEAIGTGGVVNWYNNATVGWQSTTPAVPGGSPDTALTRGGPATLQHGFADASSPVAQTIQAQSIASGTSNSSAAAFTFTNNAARGTGTGIGGAIVFQTAPVGLSSTNQNPLVPAFIIDGASHLRIGSMTAPSISSCGGGSPSVTGTDQAGIITLGTTATACTLTWTNAYSGTPICTVDWQNNLAVMQFTPSNVNLVLTQTNTSSNKVHYICFANKGG